MGDVQIPLLLNPDPLREIRSIERDGVPGLLTRLVTLYLEHSAVLVSALKEAVQNGDLQAQTRAAHSLKSSSASMGADTLAALCAALETIGDRTESDHAAGLLDEVMPVYSAVCDTLRSDWLDVAQIPEHPCD